ncbi:MAG TPA: sigma-70 family RNA polymerase sigma factor [Thermoanaerobaculia bacterium]|nr:sigma-70 family RNA polymerase sigma factor [Thermoanaerobaculia bacterium]
MIDPLPPPPPPPEELFLIYLPFVEKLAARIARKNRLSAEETKDFGQELKLKLIENDYGVFSSFRGSCQMKTYLTTVAANAFKDFRNKLWGKHRISAEAKRLGPVAIRLEELLKEGRSFDEAVEILRTNLRFQETRRELEEIWKRLPPKTPRRMEGEEALVDLAASGERPEETVFERERETRARVRAALDKVLRALPDEDRLLIKMVVVNSVKIATVARLYCMEQKPLYRRLEKTLKGLRSALEREGVRWDQVADLLNRSGGGFQ